MATIASNVTMVATVMLNLERPEKPCWASEAILVAVAEAADAAEEADGEILDEASLAAADALSVAEDTDPPTEDVAEDTDFPADDDREEAEAEAAEAAEEAEEDLAMSRFGGAGFTTSGCLVAVLLTRDVFGRRESGQDRQKQEGHWQNLIGLTGSSNNSIVSRLEYSMARLNSVVGRLRVKYNT